MTREQLFRPVLTIFFLFLLLGNFFRLIPTPWFRDSVVLSEALLYMISVIGFFVCRFPKSRVGYFMIGASILFVSFLYGCYLHGFVFSAFLHLLRLLAMGITIAVVSQIAFLRYRGSPLAFFTDLCKVYACASVLGFVIYGFFPESELLWLFLQGRHIGFQGDPHTGRFVSVYFDPNYYAAIAVFIFLLASYVYAMTGRKRYGVLRIAIVLSLILSWSRSGIALFAGVMLYRGFLWLRRGRFTRRHGFGLGIGAVLIGIMSIVFQEQISLLWERIIHVTEDDSAFCRYRTFAFGLDIVSEHPWFGTGINFLYSRWMETIGLPSPDSSLLALLIQIGIFPFTIACIGIVFRVYFYRKGRDRAREVTRAVPDFFPSLVVYVLGSIVFASQFNNLLFYPFWLIPVATVFLFLCKDPGILGVGRADQLGRISPDGDDRLGKGNEIRQVRRVG